MKHSNETMRIRIPGRKATDTSVEDKGTRVVDMPRGMHATIERHDGPILGFNTLDTKIETIVFDDDGSSNRFFLQLSCCVFSDVPGIDFETISGRGTNTYSYAKGLADER